MKATFGDGSECIVKWLTECNPLELVLDLWCLGHETKEFGHTSKSGHFQIVSL